MQARPATRIFAILAEAMEHHISAATAAVVMASDAITRRTGASMAPLVPEE
jgi:hypothetical protein